MSDKCGVSLHGGRREGGWGEHGYVQKCSKGRKLGRSGRAFDGCHPDILEDPSGGRREDGAWESEEI